MGGVVSAGRNNNELVEKLVCAKYLKSPHIQRVFRAVDRADYFLPTEKEHAYIDLAWKCGLLHISAPCIYCYVFEELKLKPGQSFLNLGSGTGYLSTMAGLILGTNGTNHGIELHKYVVDYAREKLEEFILHSPAIDEFDFCEPKFVVGNCLCLPQNTQLYDRVYCGAACTKEHEYYIKRLVKIGGIIVMPLEDFLLKIKRVSDNEWTCKKLMHVSFTTLISPENNETVKMPDTMPATLQEICRTTIRKVLHCVIAQENPLLAESIKSVSNKSKHKSDPNRTETFCIAIEDEDSDAEGFNRIHNLDLESGSREMNALLRLVLSMGNRIRDAPQNELVTISNSNTSDSNVSSIDERIDYSSDCTSSMSDYADMENDEVEAEEEQEQDMELDDYELPPAVKAGTSKTPQTCKKQKSFENLPNDDSMSAPEACEDEDNAHSYSRSSDCSDNKRLKVDSGIAGDASTSTEYGSSSFNDPSEVIDLMDTNSSDENFLKFGYNQEKYWNSKHKKQTQQTPKSCDKYDDSTDSDFDESIQKPKLKRKSPLPPNPYDSDRFKLSELMRNKVHMLPLPPPLIKFVNMNRNNEL